MPLRASSTTSARCGAAVAGICVAVQHNRSPLPPVPAAALISSHNTVRRTPISPAAILLDILRRRRSSVHLRPSLSLTALPSRPCISTFSSRALLTCNCSAVIKGTRKIDDLASPAEPGFRRVDDDRLPSSYVTLSSCRRRRRRLSSSFHNSCRCCRLHLLRIPRPPPDVAGFDVCPAPVVTLFFIGKFFPPAAPGAVFVFPPVAAGAGAFPPPGFG